MFPENFEPDIFKSILDSWYASLIDPACSQGHVLTGLLKGYRKTDYGRNRGASEISGASEFRASFPIIDYGKLTPYLVDVQRGNYRAILPEPLLCWVMTRGSTGPAKVLPATKTHVDEILACGARGLMNYVLRKRAFTLLAGRILNLNFPSNVHTITANGVTMVYGYSSGTYARLNPMLNQISLLPKQEEIDALGSGIGKHDWEKGSNWPIRKEMVKTSRP